MKILVPLDQSVFSQHALPLALRIAHEHSASMELVQVCTPLRRFFPWRVEEALEREWRQVAQSYLDAIVLRLTAKQVRANACVLEGSSVVKALLRHAKTSKADLLVMTTHGRGPLARMWLGSIADGLLRNPSTPLLLVRPARKDPDLTEGALPRRILVPLDGSALAEDSLSLASKFFNRSSPRFTLVRVIRPQAEFERAFEFSSSPARHDLLLQQLQAVHRREWNEAKAYLDRIATNLKGHSVDCRIVSHEQPARAILNVSRAARSDLIAIATHGRSGMKRLLLGSVADKVMRGASVPVLIC